MLVTRKQAVCNGYLCQAVYRRRQKEPEATVMTAQQPVTAFIQCTRKPGDHPGHQSLPGREPGVLSPGNRCGPGQVAPESQPHLQCQWARRRVAFAEQTETHTETLGFEPPTPALVQPGGLAPGKSKMHVLVWAHPAWSVGNGAPSLTHASQLRAFSLSGSLFLEAVCKQA